MDDRLRRLERAWKETGSAADERAFRLGQLRAGALSEVDLVAMSVRQVLIQPTGQLGKGPDPRVVLEELTAADPLLSVRRSSEQHIPVWRSRRRIPWMWTLCAPSDALLEEGVGRLRAGIERELEISPPAPVFHQTLSGELHHTVIDDWSGEPTDELLLTFARTGDMGAYRVDPGDHTAREVEQVRSGVLEAVRQAEPVWLPFSGFEVGFYTPRPPQRWRGLHWLTAEAVGHAIQTPERHRILEPWVRVTVSGVAAGQAIHALAKEGGWADGGEGSTHHGVIALRRLPRARKQIEREGCGVTWVYERHEPAHEDRAGIERLLRDLGWNLGETHPAG